MQDRRWEQREFGKWAGRGSHRAHSGSEGGRKELEKKKKEIKSEGTIQREGESLKEKRREEGREREAREREGSEREGRKGPISPHTTCTHRRTPLSSMSPQPPHDSGMW